MSTTTRTVVCPHCRTKLRTAAAPEKRVSCPKCKAPFLPKTTVQTTPETKVVCSSCETKIKSVKPGAKFKCPKCGAIERAAPASEPPPPAVNGKKPKEAPAKPAVKPVPVKKPAPKAKVKSLSMVTDKAPTPPPKPTWKPKPIQAARPKPAPSKPSPPAPPKPAPPKPSPPAPPSRPRRRNDDDEESSWRISGKLLTTLIVLVLLGAIVGAWSLFGGDSGPDRAAVQGEVTIDGQPVELGTIHFIPLDKGRTVAMGAKKIENGKYKIAREEGPSIGMHKVDIRVHKKTGEKLPSFMGAAPEDKIVEGAAERFNVKTELTFDVKPGTNTKSFDISAR